MQISIAMCTYNGALYLREMLESFTQQTQAPLELVVCDDGSTDATLSILTEFSRRSAFPVRITCNVSNLGYSRNFAQAMGLCKGEVIALADQDDVWYPQKLSRLAEAFASDPALEGAFSDGNLIGQNSQLLGRTLWKSFLFDDAELARWQSGRALDVLLCRTVVTGMAFAIRRTALDLLPAMPASWPHDAWLAMRIAMRSRLQAVPEQLVGYRVHSSQEIGTPLPTHEKLQVLQQGGLRAYLQRSRGLNVKGYRMMAQQFTDLLALLEPMEHDDVFLDKVRAKIAFAHRGLEALALPRFKRVPFLLPAMASYATFSPNGLRGFFRDLVI